MKSTPFPDLLPFADVCPAAPAPCPEAISADDPGFLVVNYRNEPLGFRVYDPAKLGTDGKPGSQADGFAGDLALALQSRTDRKLATPRTPARPGPAGAINGTQFPPPLNATASRPGDPFTPLAPRLLRRPGPGEDSGRRRRGVAQRHHPRHEVAAGRVGLRLRARLGLAELPACRHLEQFTFASPALPVLNGGVQADQLWVLNTSEDGYWNGVWGLLRNYKNAAAQPERAAQRRAPSPSSSRTPRTSTASARRPRSTPFDVCAVLANDVLAQRRGRHHRAHRRHPADERRREERGGNRRSTPRRHARLQPPGPTIARNGRSGAAPRSHRHDLVRTADPVAATRPTRNCIDAKGRLDPTLPACPVMLKAGAPVEPIVLRVAAGECMVVTLRNRLPGNGPRPRRLPPPPGIVPRDQPPGRPDQLQQQPGPPLEHGGLHPSLVAFDVTMDDGMATGPKDLPATARA